MLIDSVSTPPSRYFGNLPPPTVYSKANSTPLCSGAPLLVQRDQLFLLVPHVLQGLHGARRSTNVPNKSYALLDENHMRTPIITQLVRAFTLINNIMSCVVFT